VMRLVTSPARGVVYATDDDDVWGTTDYGATWQLLFDTAPLTPGGYHLHGLAVAWANPSVLYVGTGFGNWPETPVANPKIWRTANGGTTSPWPDSGPLPNWGINSTNCTNDPFQTECTSLYTIAVSPTDAAGNTVYVGTFGSENYPAGTPYSKGKGRGVIRRRSTDGGNTWYWEEIKNGLCNNNASGPCMVIPRMLMPIRFGSVLLR
jgi:hypothetical protein